MQHFTGNLNDLTDDLSAGQLILLLDWLWVRHQAPTRSAVKAWRKANNLPID